MKYNTVYWTLFVIYFSSMLIFSFQVLGNKSTFKLASPFYVMKQIGPNVSVSANARIGAGSRLISCIILDDVEIKVRIYLCAENLNLDSTTNFFVWLIRRMQFS